MPHKTVVCNETQQSHEIKDIYCRIQLKRNNTFTIETARATYTTAEMVSNYTHSHVNGVSSTGNTWLITCMGSHSPLKTMSENGIHDDLDWINLFNEIDRFYEVESLRGVPYRRIENISDHTPTFGNQNVVFTPLSMMSRLDEKYKDFAFYVAKDILKNQNALSVSDNTITLNETTEDFKIRVNNALIEYINTSDSPEEKRKLFEPILEKNIKNKYGFYQPLGRRLDCATESQYLFTFKGRLLHRTVIPSRDIDIILMPNMNFVAYIYIKCLAIFNYERYRSSTETVKIIL